MCFYYNHGLITFFVQINFSIDIWSGTCFLYVVVMYKIVSLPHFTKMYPEIFKTMMTWWWYLKIVKRGQGPTKDQV